MVTYPTSLFVQASRYAPAGGAQPLLRGTGGSASSVVVPPSKEAGGCRQCEADVEQQRADGSGRCQTRSPREDEAGQAAPLTGEKVGEKSSCLNRQQIEDRAAIARHLVRALDLPRRSSAADVDAVFVPASPRLQERLAPQRCPVRLGAPRLARVARRWCAGLGPKSESRASATHSTPLVVRPTLSVGSDRQPS